MKMVVLLIGLSACCCWAGGLDEVIAPGTQARCLADGFKFTEGATVNAAGEVFFTDQPNDKI